MVLSCTMYFEIDNTPEHIRRARRAQVVQKESPKEECPRLVLAPFTRPPQVIFDNVLIGSTCERNLEVYNPSKQAQQITLGRALPPGLVLHLPGEWMYLEPETCYILTLMWTPSQPTTLRETVRFTNENRGRYDVIVVLKSVMNVKGKNNNSKVLKISPGKVKKKATKKSPISINKKRAEIIYNSTKVQKTIDIVHTMQYRQQKTIHLSNKENMSTYEYRDTQPYKCPFDSPTSVDLNFDTSEIFSNMRQATSNNLMQQTYDKSEILNNENKNNILNPKDNNILKPSNKQNVSVTDMFDNLSFTPLKSVPSKNEKLDRGPNIIFSMNSESDFDDSLNMNKENSNKENETHSIVITSSQPPNKWLISNHHSHYENPYIETPTISSKKIPNTSSPKEFTSPNFSINTDFSRISDLSFFPQRFSTERKILPKINNETHEIIDITNAKLSSDTYTKESPNMEYLPRQFGQELKPDFVREQPKMCRQSLFKDFQRHNEVNLNSNRNHLLRPDQYQQWNNDFRNELRSPPRSITPPLQSIPEESGNADTQILDNTDKQMTTFTINRTFDKSSAISHSTRQSWSKKAVKVEPDLWKMPVALTKTKLNKSKSTSKSKESLSGKNRSNVDNNKSINQNISLNHMGNIYSQSFTVDPFLSSTYFYDEKAVENFEKEFKRWLNCVLTPPADLDSNIEQKIDVGKAWIENRNKDVPAAPTKEQVCSVYHNSHRLESLRRAARALLLTPEISQVFLKLNSQIEKKLIAIRTDRNLHLDVGLQKIIMELLLSYNPLWLRIGLEAIYGLVLPLKSNSDIEGLTTFIIQRMFRNPYLKNKHSKSSAPNMLLPAYMEAIKKFTLKKFFMLVFFLDQAKQKKLISHDPCLFCRNAVCKESREIVIRFTRELIAGIGDITKHLRPLGYVVSHKQSYLDEYKYAVHNIAIDIRDGVRLTKVMEIILMKDGLLRQLRTPAISRLQKVHNVQVALNALKEANFVIVGDITAADIADGHREKTLSLLWQLIHVFRAPLFEKAANVIQTWWRKKFEVIMEKRREEERILRMHNNAASVIQHWWRRIQYNRMIETRIRQVTAATITIQKYFRMWYYRSRMLKLKSSVTLIEKWYKDVKLMREARETLNMLRLEREKLRCKSAIIIQSCFRRWVCSTVYKSKLRKIVLIQSLIRRFLARKHYLKTLKYILYVQQKYKGKLQMKNEMKKYMEIKSSVVLIQSYFRMHKQRSTFVRLKEAVRKIEDYYIALIKMRRERNAYLKLKLMTTKVQSIYRSKIVRKDYLRQYELLVKLQRQIRAHQSMLKDRAQYVQTVTAVKILQRHIKSYLITKKIRSDYIQLRTSAVTIQRHYRSYLLTKSQRTEYLKLKKAATVIQVRYRSLLQMRRDRSTFLELKNFAVIIQQRFRAKILMRQYKNAYLKLRMAAVVVQERYKALLKMRDERSKYLRYKSSCVTIQNAYRAYRIGKQTRELYLKQKEAALKIQAWYRAQRIGKVEKQHYVQLKQASTTIQKMFRAYIAGKRQRQEYLLTKSAIICIQKYYRCYIQTKIIRRQYIELKKSTIVIQRYYRSYTETKRQRQTFLQIKAAATLVQCYYRSYKETVSMRQRYLELRRAAVVIQTRYNALCKMRIEKQKYLALKQSVLTVQRNYRAIRSMRKERQLYLKLRSATIAVQGRWRANLLMKQERSKYLKIRHACSLIQAFYRAYKKGREERNRYIALQKASLTVQRRYRALLMMRNDRKTYQELKIAAIIIQKRFRARCLMIEERLNFLRIKKAGITIQNAYRAYVLGKIQREKYLTLRATCIVIQKRYRELKETQKVRKQYLQILNTVVLIQRRVRAINIERERRRIEAANKIKIWYASVLKTRECRLQFIKLRKSVVTIQSFLRMYIQRKQYVTVKTAAITIQRYYRFYKLAKSQRHQYVTLKTSVIKLQSHVRCFIERRRYLKVRTAVLIIQAAFRLKRERDILQKKREKAAVCLQKNIRRYLVQSRYCEFRSRVIFIQKLWRGKLVTRLMRCEFLQKRNIVIKLQSVIRGYLVRKQVEYKREHLMKIKEEQRRNLAASKIQALFRGHRVRVASNRSVEELRRRWREGALKSTQESLKQRNEEAMDVLSNMSDIETVIRAFQSLELLTEIFPMMYTANASSIVRRVYVYMSVTNRSISSIEVLKSAASVLVNLTRYRVTGPKIYARDRITPVLKFMWRFSNSETHLFCILATYLWLFAKYDTIKQDLTEFLHIPENHKMLVTIKGNINRMKRMAGNLRNKISTPQPSKIVSHSMNHSLRDCHNNSVCSTGSTNAILLPALEPDYGITRMDKPRYFEDAQQAITCLFNVYKL